MEITKILNYIKTIINNSKKRNGSIKNLRKGLNEYLATLYTEGVITEYEGNIITGIISRLDQIMKSEMTVDEAFVRAMCDAQNTEYVEINTENKEVSENKPVQAKTTIQKQTTSSKKPSSAKKTTTRKKVVKETAYTPTPQRHSNPWDSFYVEPDGSCGRIQEARKKAAYEEWLHHRSCDGIPYKCRT